MYKLISLKDSNDNKHKYEVEILNQDTGRTKKIKFGKYGMSDFTIYNKTDGSKIANERKKLYIIRHQKRENWTKTGILTKGFWARWLLWSKKDLQSSLKFVIKKFNL